MNRFFAKVKASSRFGKMIIPWNNYRPDPGKRDLDGPTERCGLTRLSKNHESEIGDRATMAFASPHILVSIKISLKFFGYIGIFSF
jgi:hypothetical protein